MFVSEQGFILTRFWTLEAHVSSEGRVFFSWGIIWDLVGPLCDSFARLASLRSKVGGVKGVTPWSADFPKKYWEEGVPTVFTNPESQRAL